MRLSHLAATSCASSSHHTTRWPLPSAASRKPRSGPQSWYHRWGKPTEVRFLIYSVFFPISLLLLTLWLALISPDTTWTSFWPKTTKKTCSLKKKSHGLIKSGNLWRLVNWRRRLQKTNEVLFVENNVLPRLIDWRQILSKLYKSLYHWKSRCLPKSSLV